MTITQVSQKFENGIEEGDIKVALTTADVKASGTAITILSARPSGIIQLKTPPMMLLTFATAAFATNTTMDILIAGATLGTNFLCNYNIGGGATVYDGPANFGSGPAVYVPNAALQLQTEVGNPTGGGTSTLTFYVSYRVIPAP